MRKFLFFPLLLLSNLCFAQGYYLSNEGVKLSYTGKDNKGEFTGRVELTVLDRQEDKTQIFLESYDNKNKLETTTPLSRVIEYKGGKVSNPELLQILSVASEILVKELFAEHEVSNYNPDFRLIGNAWIIGPEAKSGTKLNDQMLKFSGLGIDFMTVNISDASIVGTETLKIDGKSVPCVVISSQRELSFFLMKEKHSIKEWYGLGYGAVKLEAYDKKGKLDFSFELSQIR